MLTQQPDRRFGSETYQYFVKSEEVSILKIVVTLFIRKPGDGVLSEKREAHWEHDMAKQSEANKIINWYRSKELQPGWEIIEDQTHVEILPDAAGEPGIDVKTGRLRKR
jgi:hypothetical protein